MKKQFALLTAAALLCSMLAACGGNGASAPSTADDTAEPGGTAAEATADEGGEEAPAEAVADGDRPYIIFVNPLVGNPVFTDEEEGLKAAAEDFGFDLKIIGPSVIDDAQMVQSIETAIAEKPDAIITVPYNYSALENTYKKAEEAGIPIINTSSDSAEDAPARVCFVGTDNTQYGIMAADLLAEKMGGEANICIMMVRLDVSNQLEQKLAFEARIEEAYPGMNVVITEQDNGDTMTAVQKFQDVFRAHPEIDTVLCLNATCGNSAAQVLTEMGLEDKITVLAIDDTEETLDNITKGLIWGTMAQNFYKMGYLGGQYAMDTINGKEVPSITDSGTVLVSAENMETYKEEMAG